MTNDSYAQRNGHPRSAAKVVCVDFDGTIAPWGPLMGDRPPFEGVAEGLRSLRDAGYRIVILTSRLSPRWWEAEAQVRGTDPLTFGIDQLRFVADYLARWGLQYDEITSEKVPALAYFDDRAHRVRSIAHSLRATIDGFLLFERQP